MLKELPIIKIMYDDLPHQQRGGDPLPDDPRPKQRGGCPHVHRAASPGGKPQSDCALCGRIPQKVINPFRRRFPQLIPSRWQKSWSVNVVHPVRPSLQTNSRSNIRLLGMIGLVEWIFGKHPIHPNLLIRISNSSNFSPQATIEAERVILKIDIEGYECKALPEEIIMGSSGKRIPFIFLEWGQLVCSWCTDSFGAKMTTHYVGDGIYLMLCDNHLGLWGVYFLFVQKQAKDHFLILDWSGASRSTLWDVSRVQSLEGNIS